MKSINDQVVIDDLWKLIIEKDKVEELQPGEKTAEIYSKEINSETGYARRKLLERMRKGEMTRRQVKINAHRVWAYKPLPRAKK